MKRNAEISTIGEIEAAAARWVARRDSGLSATERCELQNWIDADPRHRAALSFYDSTWSALARPAHAGAGGELQRQLGLLAAQRGRRRIAACGALMLFLGIGVAMWNRPRPAPESLAPTAAVLIPAHQTLPDGSLAQLRGDARISVDYTTSLRRVSLKRGEAYFSVRKDPARPFVVSVAGVEVRAIGTEFAVHLGTAAVEVLVTDGLVAVDKPREPATTATSRASQAGSALATVEAGKGVVVSLASATAIPEASEIASTDLGERLAWRIPRLEFTRTPLAEAVELLNRHAPPSATRLAVADAAVGAMRITGVFRADNTAAFVLLLEGAFGVRAGRSGNTIELRRAAERTRSD